MGAMSFVKTLGQWLGKTGELSTDKQLAPLTGYWGQSEGAA